MKQSNTTSRLLFAAIMMLVAAISPVVHAEDSGVAPLPEQITVSPDPGIDFGQVMIGVSAVRRMSITNSGAAPIRITGLVVFSGAVHIQTSLPSFSSYPLSGQGMFPVLIVGRGNIDFGHVAPGQTRIHSFVIRNGGSAPLRNVMVELESGRTEGFEVVSPAEGFDLAPGARRHIVVRLLQHATVERSSTSP